MSTFRSRQFKKEDFAKLLEVEPRFEDFLTAQNQANKGLESILNGGVTFGDNGNAFWKTIDLKTQDEWIAPTLTGGWVNFGGSTAPAGYCKDGSGWVHLRGAIRSGTINAAAFTLPAGYRPAYLLSFASNSAGAYGQLIANPDGTVVPAVGSSGSFELNNATFRASDPGVATPNPAFSAASSPVSFANTLDGGAQPKAVLLASALDITKATAPVPVSLSQPAWSTTTRSGQAQILINDVQGVLPGRTYRLLFLVLGG